jgi:carotenoid cleavage dioxygenase-like enzyme
VERGGVHVGHWFDGDGAILRVQFSPTGASGLYRYVQTAAYQEESASGQLRYGNYGMVAPGAIWNHWRRPLKNAANTSVLVLPDRLLALWEGGHPHVLDLDTLETQGLTDLGSLATTQPYSAHPKRDFRTGEIFNFGVSFGRTAQLNLYRSDATGKIVQKTATPLSGIPLIHDFVLAGPYLVFLVPPIRIQSLPVILGFSSFSDAMQWQPSHGTQVLIFDRHSLKLVSQGITDACFLWHFCNGFVDRDGLIVIEFSHYEDFSINQRLKEISFGEIQTEAHPTSWRMCIDPQTGAIKSSQQILDWFYEFPVVPPSQVGQPWQHTYFSTYRGQDRERTDLPDAIAHFDHKTENLVIVDLGGERYPNEPIYAPDIHHPNHGWIITVVYDAKSDRSEIWVYDSQHLDADPVVRLALPQVVPPGFHGTWRSG